MQQRRRQSSSADNRIAIFCGKVKIELPRFPSEIDNLRWSTGPVLAFRGAAAFFVVVFAGSVHPLRDLFAYDRPGKEEKPQQTFGQAWQALLVVADRQREGHEKQGQVEQHALPLGGESGWLHCLQRVMSMMLHLVRSGWLIRFCWITRMLLLVHFVRAGRPSCFS